MLSLSSAGGPGGGKTTAGDLLRREFGARVAFVPEAATLLFSGGFPRCECGIGGEICCLRLRVFGFLFFFFFLPSSVSSFLVLSSPFFFSASPPVVHTVRLAYCPSALSLFFSSPFVAAFVCSPPFLLSLIRRLTNPSSDTTLPAAFTRSRRRSTTSSRSWRTRSALNTPVRIAAQSRNREETFGPLIRGDTSSFLISACVASYLCALS